MKRPSRRFIAIVGIIIVAAGIAFGANMLRQNSRYVSTNNARITASLVPVTLLSPGQIVSLNVDIGSYVVKGQQLAEVGKPRAADSATMQGYRAEPASLAAVEAPVSGLVAAVWVYPGAMISAGQPIVTIYDTSSVWVTANIDETQLTRLRPGQPTQITVDSLGATITGRVGGVAAATAATFSLLPQQNTSSNFIKVVQVVPVKITIDNPQTYPLVPGTSVEVKILTN